MNTVFLLKALVNASKTASGDAEVWPSASAQQRASPAAFPLLQLHQTRVGRVHKWTGMTAKIHGLCTPVATWMGIWVSPALSYNALARGMVPSAPLLPGRARQVQHIKLDKISAVTNSWAQGVQFGRRWASLDLRRDQLPQKRVCVRFHISLNHPLKKFTTTLSDLYKRHKQDNPSIIRVAKLRWAAQKQQPHAACSRDLPQIQKAAWALRLLMGKWGRTRSPISSQHTSLCSTPHISDTQHC